MTTLTARERKLIRRVVKALRAEFDVELREAVRQERDTIVHGLHTLGKLNGSGKAVMELVAGTDRMTKAINHAPKGGATIAGVEYRGGMFIPDAELAKATPEEKATLEKKQKEQSGQYGAWGAAAAGEEEKGKETAPAPAKPHTVDSAEALARKLTGASGPDRAETVRQLSEAIGTLSKKEQDELKGRLGIKASGNRADMARKIAERHASTDRTNRQQYVNEKVSVEDAEKRVKDALSDGSLKTPEGRRAVAKLLGEGLTGEELQSLKRKLGVKASGSKAEVARKIAERAATNATPKDVAPQPPEEPAVTQGATNGVAPTTQDVAGKQPWEMTRAEMLKHNDIAPNNSLTPWEGEVPPIGSWRMDPSTGEIEQLKQFDPHSLKLTEPESDVKGTPQVEAYTKWAAQGKQAPPITVVNHIDTGEPLSLNRRRVMAARAAGKPVMGWHSDIPAGQYRGVTHRAAVEAALAAGKPVPPEVLADYPDLAPRSTTPASHPDDAELYTLNRTPYKQLTKEQRARRDELSRAYSARQYPGSTPFLMGGGKGPGVSDSENESTAGKVAAPSAAPPAPLSVPELVAKIREIDERNAGRTLSTRDRMDRNDLESAVIQSGAAPGGTLPVGLPPSGGNLKTLEQAHETATSPNLKKYLSRAVESAEGDESKVMSSLSASLNSAILGGKTEAPEQVALQDLIRSMGGTPKLAMWQADPILSAIKSAGGTGKYDGGVVYVTMTDAKTGNRVLEPVANDADAANAIDRANKQMKQKQKETRDRIRGERSANAE